MSHDAEGRCPITGLQRGHSQTLVPPTVPSKPQLLHPSLLGARMGRTTPDPADGESHGPGWTSPHCRAAGAEHGAMGRTRNLGMFTACFTTPINFPPNTAGGLFDGSPWQGTRDPSYRTPLHPLHGRGLGDLNYIEQAAFSCPQSGGHLRIGGMCLQNRTISDLNTGLLLS